MSAELLPWWLYTALTRAKKKEAEFNTLQVLRTAEPPKGECPNDFPEEAQKQKENYRS